MTWIAFALFALFYRLNEERSDHHVSPAACLAYKMNALFHLYSLDRKGASPPVVVDTLDAGGSVVHGRNCPDAYPPTDSSNNRVHTDGSRGKDADADASSDEKWQLMEQMFSLTKAME